MRVLDLFSGIGGFSLGLERAGMRTVAFCEIDRVCWPVLKSHWPDVRIYEDIREISASGFAADGIAIDAICGGFPCQDASVANVRGLGTSGPRTGLFREVVRVARDIRPRVIILENVAGLLTRGIGDVLGALAEIGYDAEWSIISAREAGADHQRARIWFVAYPCGTRWEGLEPHHSILERAEASLAQYGDRAFEPWRELVGDQSILRSCDGLSVTMERARLHQLGNAVVPIIPEIIGRAIMSLETGINK